MFEDVGQHDAVIGVVGELDVDLLDGPEEHTVELCVGQLRGVGHDFDAIDHDGRAFAFDGRAQAAAGAADVQNAPRRGGHELAHLGPVETVVVGHGLGGEQMLRPGAPGVSAAHEQHGLAIERGDAVGLAAHGGQDLTQHVAAGQDGPFGGLRAGHDARGEEATALGGPDDDHRQTGGLEERAEAGGGEPRGGLADVADVQHEQHAARAQPGPHGAEFAAPGPSPGRPCSTTAQAQRSRKGRWLGRPPSGASMTSLRRWSTARCGAGGGDGPQQRRDGSEADERRVGPAHPQHALHVVPDGLRVRGGQSATGQGGAELLEGRDALGRRGPASSGSSSRASMRSMVARSLRASPGRGLGADS